MYTNLYITYIYLFVYFKSDYFSVIFTSVSFCMDESVHILPITTENFNKAILTSCVEMTCHARRQFFVRKLQYFLSFEYN